MAPADPCALSDVGGRSPRGSSAVPTSRAGVDAPPRGRARLITGATPSPYLVRCAVSASAERKTSIGPSEREKEMRWEKHRDFSGQERRVRAEEARKGDDGPYHARVQRPVRRLPRTGRGPGRPRRNGDDLRPLTATDDLATARPQRSGIRRTDGGSRHGSASCAAATHSNSAPRLSPHVHARAYLRVHTAALAHVPCGARPVEEMPPDTKARVPTPTSRPTAWGRSHLSHDGR